MNLEKEITFTAGENYRELFKTVLDLYMLILTSY